MATKRKRSSEKINEHSDRTGVSEIVYGIANLAHAEYHMLETIMVNNCDVPDELVRLSKEVRVARTDLMKKLIELRPGLRGVWCVLKHLSLSEFHMMETFEKYQDKDYLLLALKVHMQIDKLLSIDGLDKLKSCNRCEDDKENNNEPIRNN